MFYRGLLAQALLEELSSLLGKEALAVDPQVRTLYGNDWSNSADSIPCAVVFPETVKAVQEVVRWAQKHAVSLVPSGGRTGYSGGAVASEGQLVVSLDKLNSISDFDPINNTVRCGAGVVTAQLQAFATDKDRLYPVDFASSGSSQIGGNIATNAGGIRVIRYGMTRDWVAGLRVVSATGELLDLNRGLVKNNAGYDLRHLFVGSEGTLGIIVEATMRLCSRPPASAVLLLGASSLVSILSILRSFKDRLRLLAFEFFSASGLERVVASLGLPNPLNQSCEFYALVEVECPSQEEKAKLEDCIEKCTEAGWLVDGVLAHSEVQARKLWRYREEISATIAPQKPLKHDISTTVSRMPELLDELQKLVDDAGADLTTVWFGHIGDGNIHLNLLAPDSMSPDEFAQHCRGLSQAVFSAVQKHGGSVSAEHGVGLLKKPYLHYSHGPGELHIMKAIKRSLDPMGIMNPGKILDV
ncbi:MAG: FAD-binding oxidoreductase [Pseudomonadota bacterium]